MDRPASPQWIEVADRRPIPALLGQVVDDLLVLVRTEVKLARAEITTSIASLVRPLVFVAAAALLGLAALFTLMGALVGFLTPYVGAGWAALIVASVVGLIAFLLLQAGLKGFGAFSLAPRHAAASVKKDVAAIKESVS